MQSSGERICDGTWVSPTGGGNKNRTAILEKVAKLAIEAMLRELENKKKAT